MFNMLNMETIKKRDNLIRLSPKSKLNLLKTGFLWKVNLRIKQGKVYNSMF